MGTNELTKQKQSHRCKKQTYGYQGISGGGISWEIGTDIYIHTTVYKIDN